MTRTHYPRIDGPFTSSAGWWIECLDDEGGMVMWKCPTCHRVGALAGHSVDANGEVNASVACNGRRSTWSPLDGKTIRSPCDFHEWIVLDDWPDGVTKTAGELVPMPRMVA